MSEGPSVDTRTREDRGIIVDRGIVKTNVKVHDVNPALLLEKIIRERILDSLYWKEQCFGLTAATICDRAAELTCIGGQYANQKPTAFLCLAFKLLQLQPDKEIVMAYLENEDFKYLTALAAFYIRLTFPPVDTYQILEGLYKDYRKLRERSLMTASFPGGIRLTYMDEFADNLLTLERVCDIALPRLPSRISLEDLELLEPRESALASELEDEESEEEEEEEKEEDTNGSD